MIIYIFGDQGSSVFCSAYKFFNSDENCLLFSTPASYYGLARILFACRDIALNVLDFSLEQSD